MTPRRDEMHRPAAPERLELANLPTPIRRLGRLPGLEGGPELFIKRDDLTGMGTTGNKIRKLEYLLAEAKARGADTVITCGGIQSNHARATAVAAARTGVEAHLLLREEDGPEPDRGNLFLGRLCGARVHRISRVEYAERDRIMEALAEELAGKGRKAYSIPEGGSNALGAWGYIQAVSEIKAHPEPFDRVVCALGSGGTCAGLEIGRALEGLAFEVVAVNVCDDAAAFRRRITTLFEEFEARYKLPPGADPGRIRILDGFVGPGYAKSWPEELRLIRDVALHTGIFLDPVYTGKAFFGLVDQIRMRGFSKKEKVLFIHTGGIFGLLAQCGEFAGLVDPS